MRALLIEDHPDLVALTAGLVSASGFEVRTALCGRDALETAPAFRPQLVLCDLHLPDMPGLDVIRALRASPSTERSYIAVLTATPDLGLTPHELIQLSVDAFISKPLTHEALRLLAEELGQRENSPRR